MNLKEAYQKMLEGKKVKRKGRSLCCFYNSNENKFCTGDGVPITGITFEAALAEDWEVVVEKNKIMNKFERLRLSNYILRVCIEHVLEKYADGLLYVERENCIKFC